MVAASLWCIRYVIVLDEVGPLRLANQVLLLILIGWSLVHAFTRKSLPLYLVELPLLGFGLVYGILNDIYGAGVHEFWLLSFLSLDGMLLAGARRTASSALASIMTLWIIIRTFEEATRDVGIWDAVPYKNDEELIRDELGGWWGGLNGGLRVSVFVINFLMTRYFVDGMRRRHQQVMEAIEMAETVASAMVRFDLDEAAELVGEGSGRSESDGLRRAFQGLLSNLRQYRPYLPDSILTRSDSAYSGLGFDEEESVGVSEEHELPDVAILQAPPSDGDPVRIIDAGSEPERHPTDATRLARPRLPSRLAGNSSGMLSASVNDLTQVRRLSQGSSGRRHSNASSRSNRSMRSMRSARPQQAQRRGSVSNRAAHLRLGLVRQHRAVVVSDADLPCQQERGLFLHTSSVGSPRGGDPETVSSMLCRWLERVVDVTQQNGVQIEQVAAAQVLISAGGGGRRAGQDTVTAAVTTAFALSRPGRQSEMLETGAAIIQANRTGVSMGEVLAGNVGASVKRYPCLLGQPVREAEALMHLCQHLEVQVLASDLVARQATGGAVTTRPVERLCGLPLRFCAYPPEQSGATPALVHQVTAKMAPGLALYTQAWELAAAGRTQDAAARMAQYCAEAPMDNVAEAVLRRLQAAGGAEYVCTLIPHRVAQPEHIERARPLSPRAASMPAPVADDPVAEYSQKIAYIVSQLPVSDAEGKLSGERSARVFQDFASVCTEHGATLERVGGDRLCARWDGAESEQDACRAVCRLVEADVPALGVSAGECRRSPPVLLGSGMGASTVVLTQALAKAEALAAFALASDLPCVSNLKTRETPDGSSVQWRLAVPSASFSLPCCHTEGDPAPTPAEPLAVLSRTAPSVFYRRALEAVEAEDWEAAHAELQKACDVDDTDSWSKRLRQAVGQAKSGAAPGLVLVVSRAGASFTSETAQGPNPSGSKFRSQVVGAKRLDGRSKPSAKLGGTFFSKRGGAAAAARSPDSPVDEKKKVKKKLKPAATVAVAVTTTPRRNPLAVKHLTATAPAPLEPVDDSARLAEDKDADDSGRDDVSDSDAESRVYEDGEGDGALASIHASCPASRHEWVHRRELVQSCLGYSRPSARGLLVTVDDSRTLMQVLAKHWNVLVLAAGMYNCLMVPARVVFDPNPSDSTQLSMCIFVFNYVVDLINWGDIAFNFVEPYMEDGMEITDPKLIAGHYIKAGFARDLTMVFPWEIAYGLIAGWDRLVRDHWVRFNRCLSVTTFNSLADTIEVEFVESINPVVLQLGRHLIQILYVVWWLGCLWGAIFIHVGTDEELRDYLGTDIKDEHPSIRSMHGFHWALRAFAGYGQARWPKGTHEHLCALFVSIVGVAIFASLLAHVQRLLDIMNSSQVMYSNKIDECYEFFDYHNIPDDAAHEVKTYHAALWQRTRQAFHGQHTDVLGELPMELSGEFRFYSNLDVIPQVPELTAIQVPQLVVNVVSVMEHWLVPTGERIFTRGDESETMMFLFKGRAAARIGDVEVEALSGDIADTAAGFWGEVACIFGGPQMATVEVLEYSEVFFLDGDSFALLSGPWMAPFVDKAQERRQRMRQIIAEETAWFGSATLRQEDVQSPSIELCATGSPGRAVSPDHGVGLSPSDKPLALSVNDLGSGTLLPKSGSRRRLSTASGDGGGSGNLRGGRFGPRRSASDGWK
eukprot:TRINITY_DN28710_c0_g1_i1.p1 TRINITY_DN28710_c0_g1~~TRINITY_DN28710_c0_g1_i1.p1  ORF type:complete len:1733 (+),score=331.83 TRINITY_DN28710_c0_g1_i1:182-5200(+)